MRDIFLSFLCKTLSFLLLLQCNGYIYINKINEHR